MSYTREPHNENEEEKRIRRESEYRSRRTGEIHSERARREASYETGRRDESREGRRREDYTERRQGNERRRSEDRRGEDRRSSDVRYYVDERRSGERRRNIENRSGEERRRNDDRYYGSERRQSGERRYNSEERRRVEDRRSNAGNGYSGTERRQGVHREADRRNAGYSETDRRVAVRRENDRRESERREYNHIEEYYGTTEPGESNHLGIIIKVVAALLAVAVIIGFVHMVKAKKDDKKNKGTDVANSQTVSVATPSPTPEVTATPTPSPTPEHIEFKTTSKTVDIPAVAAYDAYELYPLTPLEDAAVPCTDDEDKDTYQTVCSSNFILVDLDTNEIVAQREPERVLSPASMAKILTVLTALDYITEEDMDDKYTITQEICDYVYINECSAVSYAPGDTCTVKDLLYGTIVKSAADCAVGLSDYVMTHIGNPQASPLAAQDEFAKLMNEKAEALGISDTAHFTNCVGLYDENLHCTVNDMAVILAHALKNPYEADMLKTRDYKVGPFIALPEGTEVHNTFIQRIEDFEIDGTIIAGKTGFVNESGSCCASAIKSKSGKTYVLVTANANLAWRVVHDHISIYRAFTH